MNFHETPHLKEKGEEGGERVKEKSRLLLKLSAEPISFFAMAVVASGEICECDWFAEKCPERTKLVRGNQHSGLDGPVCTGNLRIDPRRGDHCPEKQDRKRNEHALERDFETF